MININYLSTPYSRFNKNLNKTSNINVGTVENNHINITNKFKENDLYDEELNYYCNNIDLLLNYYDDTYINKNKLLIDYIKINQLNIKNNKIINKNICYNCQDKNLIVNNNNFLICKKCGYIIDENITFVNNKYNDDNNNNMIYKRISHIRELLMQLQSKN